MAAKLLQISENSALSPVFLHKNVIDSRKTEYQEHNYAQNRLLNCPPVNGRSSKNIKFSSIQP